MLDLLWNNSISGDAHRFGRIRRGVWCPFAFVSWYDYREIQYNLRCRALLSVVANPEMRLEVMAAWVSGSTICVRFSSGHRFWIFRRLGIQEVFLAPP